MTGNPSENSLRRRKIFRALNRGILSILARLIISSQFA
jgi:hypothetical protein